ncbi:hypothetical protein FEM48_Zijuj11G0057700 [Ziziphus jujuba var. spinosa]|uniref:Gag-Pol polyprotein n=1 Tax=Ziziphus jujuba var. spinosa TaxID=714518 RepID=A0A978UH64_ZIZJJ|nr:hypothetical protein FEM48_Zijuj11G0057700 [Ziziphus jujuba var. spinosa]
MTNAIQQQPRAGNANIVEQFQRLQPPSLEGSTDSLVAEDWIREMEKIFSFLKCTDAQKKGTQSLRVRLRNLRALRDGLRRPISVLWLQTYGEVLQTAQILKNDHDMSVKVESKERGTPFGEILYASQVLKSCIVTIDVVSALQARRWLRKWCRGFLASVVDTSKEDLTIRDVKIINEFADVFPDELPGILHE